MNAIYYSQMRVIGALEIENTFHSDYSGSTIERANYEYLVRHLTRYHGFYAVSGDYFTRGIAYVPSELTDVGLDFLADIMERLESYPLLDEELHSRIEYDILSDYLTELERDRDLADKLPLTEDQESIFWDNAIIETGCVPYFNTDKWIEA